MGGGNYHACRSKRASARGDRKAARAFVEVRFTSTDARYVFTDELVPWQSAFLEGCAELGFDECKDTNDPTVPGGAGPHATNKIDGPHPC